MEKLLQVWTCETLSVRIAEGEQLLKEFESEPPWMGDLVARELMRKRALLGVLQSTR
jgi:hypothetical protein